MTTHPEPDPPARLHVGPLLDEEDFERFIGKFTNYERMKEYRYAADSMDLGRMEGLARELGDPHRACPAVHIAGTKGKGTTSLILEALLAASGFSVGTYISPHVERLRERIRFGGEPIAAGDLCAAARSLLPILRARWPQGPRAFPTFFELMTALAMVHFRDRRADWAIYEVGLGGRLDATNILRPRWTAITSIGLEHTDKLGDTIESIAREKAGIVKPATPVILGSLPSDAERTVRRIAGERGAPVVRADPLSVRRVGPDRIEVDGGTFSAPAGPIPAGAVRGPGLRADLALALALWKGILGEASRSPRREELAQALGALRLPARVEVVGGPRPAVIDGAHTPESVRALREALEEIGFPRPRGLVFALAADKPLEPILAELRGIAEEAFFTRADPARGRDPEELAEAYRSVVGGPGRAVADPIEAWALATKGGRAPVVTGSFYLAGRLRPLAVGIQGD